MTVKFKILFFIILLAGSLIRLIQLSSYPPSLNWDEVSHGYNSYSLMLTGKDQWNISWPKFNFRAYGDYPMVANLYLTIPFIKIFGLNAFSIRLPHALLGIATIIISFFLVKTIFSKISYAFIAMTLFSLSPWTVFPSRAVFQSNLSLFLLMSALLLFYQSFKKNYLLLFSALLFSLSLYSYHNTRVLVPIIVLALIAIFRKTLFKYHRFILITSSLIYLILAIPNGLNLFSPESQARNRWVGIINPNSINLINENRRLYSGPIMFNRLINNKVVYFSKTFILNYLNQVNPIPVFFNGSQNYQFNPPNTGLFYSILLPFFYLGLIISFKKYRYLLLLFLISLLPSALTVGDFPSIRATSAIPFYIIFITLGLSQLKLNKFLLIIAFIFSFQFILYIKNYYQYNQNYSQVWQYGYQPVIDYIKPLYPNYKNIIFTKKFGEPHEFILFYWPWDPNNYLSDPALSWDYHSDWYWVNSFDKFKFQNDWDIANLQIPPSTLLITGSGNYPKANSKLLNTIYFLNHTPAFDIVAYD